MAVGQRNAVVSVLPVFIFHVLVRKLVSTRPKACSLRSACCGVWMGRCNSSQNILVTTMRNSKALFNEDSAVSYIA